MAKSTATVNPNLEAFFDGLLHFGNRIVGGRGAVDRLALFVDDKLGEVPLDGVHHEAGLLVLEVLPERVRIPTVHIDLGEHVEGDVVLTREGLNQINICKEHVRYLLGG